MREKKKNRRGKKADTSAAACAPASPVAPCQALAPGLAADGSGAGPAVLTDEVVDDGQTVNTGQLSPARHNSPCDMPHTPMDELGAPGLCHTPLPPRANLGASPHGMDDPGSPPHHCHGHNHPHHHLHQHPQHPPHHPHLRPHQLGGGPPPLPSLPNSSAVLPSIHQHHAPLSERTPERHGHANSNTRERDSWSAGARNRGDDALHSMLQRNCQRDLAADLGAAQGHEVRSSLSRRSQYTSLENLALTPAIPHRDNISVTPLAQRRDTFQLTPLSPLPPPKNSGGGGAAAFHLPSLSKKPGRAGPDMLQDEKQHLDGLHREAGKPDGGGGETKVKLQPRPPRKPKPRCAKCNRRLKLASTYTCRCGGMFCGQCRYAEVHDCEYDYKTHGRKLLEAAAPSIQAPKLPKI